jgi:hypothetical protein
MIRLMGLGGVLVMSGMLLATLAIVVQAHAEIMVPMALGLISIGVVVSLIAHRRPSIN